MSRGLAEEDLLVFVGKLDPIRINQRNIQELNHQITQMGKFYHQAKRVLWSTELTGFIGPSNDLVKTTSEDRKLTVLYSLLTHSYWKRLWIIREFLIAKEIILESGGDTCSAFRLSWYAVPYQYFGLMAK